MGLNTEREAYKGIFDAGNLGVVQYVGHSNP